MIRAVCVISILHTQICTCKYTCFSSFWKINSKCYIRKPFRLTSQFCWLLPFSPSFPAFPRLSSLQSESWETDPCELRFFSSLSASLGLAIGWTAGGEKWGCPLLCSPCWPHHSGNDCPSKNVATGVWSPTLLLPPHQTQGNLTFSLMLLTSGCFRILGGPLWGPHCSVHSLCIVWGGGPWMDWCFPWGLWHVNGAQGYLF